MRSGIPGHGQGLAASASSTSEIEAGIAETRSDLGHTIEEIQRRIRPERVAQHARRAIADATRQAAEALSAGATRAANQAAARGREAADKVADNLRAHPGTFATAGVGIGVALAAAALQGRAIRRRARARTTDDWRASQAAAAWVPPSPISGGADGGSDAPGTTAGPRASGRCRHLIASHPVLVAVAAFTAGALTYLSLTSGRS